MRLRSVWSVAAAAIAATAGACGNAAAGDTPLAATDAKLDDIRSASMSLEFSGQAIDGDGPSGPVGFRLDGPFSFESGGAYPVMRLTYTQLRGDDTDDVTVTSTGDQVFVGTKRVPDAQLKGLRLGEGDKRSSGLEQLELSDWVGDPTTTRKGDADVITGKVDVAAAFADLAEMARQLGVPDTGDLRGLSDKDRERLTKLVKDSEISVTSGHDDHVLRSVDLRVDLGKGAAADKAALGSLLGARLTLKLALDDVNEPVSVERPTGT